MGFISIGKRKAQKQLQQILKGQEVPTFPGLAMRVLEMLRNPEVDFESVAEGLQWDPALTVQILKTVNSAAYGVSQPIQDVHHAVRYLGRGALEQIVLSVAVRKVLPNPTAPGFQVERFWKAACYRAIVAKAIATRLHPAQEAASFTGALLQDLAIPVLVDALAQPYEPVLKRWTQDPDVWFHQAEKQAMGWSHDEVGGWLCTYWDMPDSLTRAIAQHHSDQVSDTELLPALRLVSWIRESQDAQALEAFLDLAKQDYGLASDDLMALTAQAEEQSVELAQMYLGS